MLLLQVVNTIKEICGLQRNVNTVSAQDVYEVMAVPTVEYGAMVLNQTAYNYDVETGLNKLAFRLFYIDRLTDDESNKLQVQNIGFEVLKNIIKNMNSLGINPQRGMVFKPFTQKFKDLCAGVYVEMTVEFYDEWSCPDDGYTPLSYDADCEEIITALEGQIFDLQNVNESLEQQIQDLYDTFQNGMIDIELTSNGEYNAEDFGASGFRTVEVNVPASGGGDCQESYDDGYADGYEQGTEDGYNTGREEGYSEGYGVGSTDGYSNGYNDGYSNGYNDGYYYGSGQGGGSVEGEKWGLTGYFNGWGMSPDVYFEPYESKVLFMDEAFDVQYIHNFNHEGTEVKIRYNNEWNLSYTADLYNEPQIATLITGDNNMYLSQGAWNLYILGNYNDFGTFEPVYMVVLREGTTIENVTLSVRIRLMNNTSDTNFKVYNAFNSSEEWFYGNPDYFYFTGQYGNLITISSFDEDYNFIREESFIVFDADEDFSGNIIWN